MTQPETAAADQPATSGRERSTRCHWRRPAGIVAGVVMLLIGIWIVYQIITNPAFDWAFTFEAMNQTQVIRGFVTGTLVATVGAMVLGVVLGVLLAVMRMSDNPILRWSAGVYVWFFRAIPRYVLLMILGAAGAFAIGWAERRNLAGGRHLAGREGGSQPVLHDDLDGHHRPGAAGGRLYGRDRRSGILSVDRDSGRPRARSA